MLATAELRCWRKEKREARVATFVRHKEKGKNLLKDISPSRERGGKERNRSTVSIWKAEKREEKWLVFS